MISLSSIELKGVFGKIALFNHCLRSQLVSERVKGMNSFRIEIKYILFTITMAGESQQSRTHSWRFLSNKLSAPLGTLSKKNILWVFSTLLLAYINNVY